MRILIVTDAWFPQTNGVVMTLAHTAAWLGRFGHEVRVMTPRDFRSVACPTYPEIRLSIFPYRTLVRRVDAFEPEAIHIATEGPLGLAARRLCRSRRLHFSTSYHTQFPQYLRLRFPIPCGSRTDCCVGFMARRMHAWSARAACRRNCRRAASKIWRAGSAAWDTQLFRPRPKAFLDHPRPIAAYVGRVAVEKNIEAFLRMPWAGTKLIIGDGPERARLQRLHPEAIFVGFRFKEDLASHLAAADILVFPSLTDTFGLVNLEAMSCGVPVAAYPVTGPVDVIEDGVSGALDVDLQAAALRALRIDPQRCREQALRSGWDLCARQFEANLVPLQGSARTRVAAVPAHWHGAAP